MKRWLIGLLLVAALAGCARPKQAQRSAVHQAPSAKAAASSKAAASRRSSEAARAASSSASAAHAKAASVQAASASASSASRARDAQAQAATLPQGTNHNARAAAYAHPAATVHAEMTRRLDPSQPKTVYLTFDDGPNLTMTPRILAVLRQAQVPATFFVVGRQVGPRTAAMLRREYDEGHAIGLHSQTHTYGFERTGNAGATAWEIDQSLAAVRRVLGVGFVTHAWRYPGGHMSWAAHLAKPDAVVAAHGMSWIDWNAASGDALGRTSPTTVPAMLAYHSRSLQAYGPHNATVVLMHDAPDKTTTLAALPQIIAYYRQRGYQFGVIA